MSKKVVTLGEIMLRLSPPQNQRLIQAASFDVNYGGGEANVAASLAQFGHHALYVTKVPDNNIGHSAIASLKKYGVDCSKVVYGGRRLGIYYLENGASIRPSSVVYDREDSAMARAVPEDFDFDAVFENADLFHVSGITASISARGAAVALAAVKCAKKHGVCVSMDLNYRAKLWEKNIQEKQEVMQTIMPYVDICFGNPLDAQKCLAYEYKNIDYTACDYETCISEKHMKAMLEKYHLKYLIATKRESISASDNGWSALVCDKNALCSSRKYHLHIVDRVGGGDAFVAGFLHGVLCDWSKEKSLEFATAAAAIKHTVPGDVNVTSAAEVEALMNGDGSGRVQR